jgi:hypothetical protein
MAKKAEGKGKRDEVKGNKSGAKALARPTLAQAHKAAAKMQKAATKSKPEPTEESNAENIKTWERQQAVALRPEVLPPETAAEAILKHPGDETKLRDIELCIDRSLAQSKKLSLASTFTLVVTGLALSAAKSIMRHGRYEIWVDTRFEGFSKRQAQYICKLSEAFLRETGGTVQLPAQSDRGDFLMRADQDRGQFAEAIRSFIGNMTMAELLDKYRIKPKKDKGGYRPSNYLVAIYQSEHAHLQHKPFEVWPESDQTDFMEWRTRQVADDNGLAIIEAAESTWTTIRNTLTVEGISNKSFSVLPRAHIEDLYDIVELVAKNLKDALKKMIEK